ncbi:MAG: helix-turn-helix domain-containing protein, partial [Ruminococcus sp.]|nr:helix-turn-helix domain-containing protein [Ruminococcus sp.]
MSVELGEQLRELRLLRTYYTQAQVAELLSIDRSSYTRYEMGTTEPPISTILKLSEIYGISCDELINPDYYGNTMEKEFMMMETMTKSERQVMELLWSSDRPLSCSEIVELSEDKTWKDSYVHSLIKSLTKKGIVEIASFELVSRSYARKFAPKISYHEYVLLSGFTQNELTDVKKMSAFIRTIMEHTDTEKMRASIREIIS